MQRDGKSRCQLFKITTMRNKFVAGSILVFVAVSLLLLQSCVKDSCKRQYTYWVPYYKTKAEVRANIKSNAPKDIEHPGKIYIRGNYIFLNEVDKGIHVIDNTNPQSPQRIAFIDIPGNLDMAVKGNMLYADLYTDLVTIDITDPHNVVLKKVNENVLPERVWTGSIYGNSSVVIVDWEKRDTIVQEDCGGEAGFFGGGWFKSGDVAALSASGTVMNIGPNAFGVNASASPFGLGGSMARFSIVGNYFYGVSNTALKVLSIQNPADPVYSNNVNIGQNIETIYPFNNKLFIGSNAGMFIYDISIPNNPSLQGQFSHARSCDPVIADNNYAYVTLRSGTRCQGFSNQMELLDITNLSTPLLLKVYPMVNPHGLAKDGNVLMICDGKAGLKIYDASAPASNIILKKEISGPETYDVIAAGGWALMVAKDGLYQYSYDNSFNVTQLSKLPVKN